MLGPEPKDAFGEDAAKPATKWQLSSWNVFAITFGVILLIAGLAYTGDGAVEWEATVAVVFTVLACLPEEERKKLLFLWRPAAFVAVAAAFAVLAAHSFWDTHRGLDVSGNVKSSANLAMKANAEANFIVNTTSRRKILTVRFRVKDSRNSGNSCSPSATMKVYLNVNGDKRYQARIVPETTMDIPLPSGLRSLELDAVLGVPNMFTTCAVDLTMPEARLHN